MASKSKPTTDPSALTVRVWIIEQRYKGFIHEPKGADWFAFRAVEGDTAETEMVLRCAKLSERYTDREFRYRAATLTFDDDGSKCVIY